MSKSVKYDEQSGIDMSVLIKCLMCLQDVKIVKFNRHMLETGIVEVKDGFTKVTNDSYINTVFYCPTIQCTDNKTVRINGEKSNGLIEIPNIDINCVELYSCNLLHAVAYLAKKQGYISNDRYDKRFAYQYTNVKMYEQVSKELLSDIQKHIYETQLYNSVSGNVQPADELINYTVAEPLEVNVYLGPKTNPLKCSYTHGEINSICHPVQCETAEEEVEEQLTPIEKAIKEQKKYNEKLKTDTVVEMFSLFDRCRDEATARFNKKYGDKLYTVME